MRHYKIGDVAKLVGLHPETIREYERMGLLGSHVGREENGYRCYTWQTVCRILAIRKMRTMGFTLQEIARNYSDYSLEEYRSGMDRNIERLERELLIQQMTLDHMREHQAFARSLPGSLNRCSLRISPEVYMVPFAREETLRQEEGELKTLRQWARYSFLTRNAAELDVDYESETASERSICLAIEAGTAEVLGLSAGRKGIHRLPQRSVYCAVRRDLQHVLYPETIRSVRQFLRQEHLEPAGARFFLSAVSFFERKESRFYSRLYIPVEG